jgi:hypothetical protein
MPIKFRPAGDDWLLKVHTLKVKGPTLTLTISVESVMKCFLLQPNIGGNKCKDPHKVNIVVTRQLIATNTDFYQQEREKFTPDRDSRTIKPGPFPLHS